MLVSSVLGLLSLSVLLPGSAETQIHYKSDYTGSFSLVAADGAHCLDNEDGMLRTGQPSHMWECSGRPHQI